MHILLIKLKTYISWSQVPVIFIDNHSVNIVLDKVNKEMPNMNIIASYFIFWSAWNWNELYIQFFIKTNVSLSSTVGKHETID